MSKKKTLVKEQPLTFLSKVKTFFTRYGWLALTIVVALYVGRLVMTPNHFHTHDDIQIFRTNEFISCLKDGQFPCRWSRDLGKGYGYPLFIFYPPMIYVIPTLITLLTKVSLAYSLNIFAYLTFALAAFSMYRLVKVLTERDDLAGFAGMLYTLLPYHALNIFVRGVYAENLAWSLSPLLFAEVYLVIKKKKSIWLLSLLLSLTVLSHNISAMLLFPLLALWGIGIVISDWKNLSSRLWQCILAGILGIGLSAFFFVPAVMEKPLVQTESMIFDYYSYLVHFPTIKQIFFSNYWGYGGSSWGVKDDGMSFALGQVQWISLVVVGLLSLWFTRSKLSRLFKNPIVLGTGFSLLFVLFLSHPRSTPIWILLTPLQYIQFPWRLVGLSGTFLVILLGYLSSFLPHKLGRVIGIISVAAALFLYGGFFRPEKFDGLNDQDFITGSMRKLEQQDHVFDYLPKTVKELPDFATGLYFSSQSPVTHKTLSWSSNKAELEVESLMEQDITLSVFVYPGWNAKVNGQEAVLKPHGRFGLATVTAPKGKSTITLYWQDTLLRKIATSISFLSVGVFILGVITSYNQGNVKKVKNGKK